MSARRANFAIATLLCVAGCSAAPANSSPTVPGVTSVGVSPSGAVALTGDTLQLTATLRDSNGAVLTGTVAWSSSDPSIVTVSSTGAAHVLKPGTVSISATVNQITSSSHLTTYAGQGVRVPGMSSYDSIIPALMAQWSIPGGVVGVVKDGRLVFMRGYGYSDVPGAVVTAPTALFRLASLSKSITAAAILTLVEAGKLSLDAKAFALISDLTPATGATVDPRLASITVRQLLNHTGGWDSNISFDPMFRSDIAANAVGASQPASAETVIRYMLGVPLDFDPGTRYAYSNFGYDVLGRIIERVSGMSYSQYAITHVLTPAGVTHMQQGHSLLSQRLPGEVLYYDTGTTTSVFPSGGAVPWPYGGFYLEAMDSHGAWVSSAADLLRFMLAVDGRSTRPDILSAASEQAMTAEPAIWNGSSYWYGMGWEVRPSGGDANWWHTGSLPGTTTLMVRAYNGLTWVALFNARNSTATSSFDNDLDAALWTASAAVTAWPTGDRFSDFP